MEQWRPTWITDGKYFFWNVRSSYSYLVKNLCVDFLGGGGVIVKSCPTLATCQDPLSMGFSRQKYRSGLPFPFPIGFLGGLRLLQTLIMFPGHSAVAMTSSLPLHSQCVHCPFFFSGLGHVRFYALSLDCSEQWYFLPSFGKKGTQTLHIWCENHACYRFFKCWGLNFDLRENSRGLDWGREKIGVRKGTRGSALIVSDDALLFVK